jgi:hypothetical protein
MKHLLRAVLTALLLSLLSSPSLAVAASCPAPLPQSTLRELDPEEALNSYVLLRWLACGPEAALPLLPLLRERLRELEREEAADDAAAAEYTGRDPQADAAGAFERQVILALSMNPAALVESVTDEEDFADASDPDATPFEREGRKYLPLLRDQRQILRHYEQGVQAGIAFLRRDTLSPPQEQLLELALVGQEIRQGRIETARQHLARIVAASPATPTTNKEDAELLQVRVELLTDALAPVQLISPAPDTQSWVIDKSTGFLRRRGACGWGGMMQALFGRDALRAEVLRRADPDAAIAEALREEWTSLIEGRSGGTLLPQLLRKRYSAAELRTGLDDAVASIHSSGANAGLMLFGQALPLPYAVLEDDAKASDGTSQRPLSPAELADLVRASDLYRQFGATPAATAATSE